MREIENAVHEPPQSLPIPANAIPPENISSDILTGNRRRTIIIITAVSARVPQQHRGLFKERHHAHGAFATRIDTSSACSSQAYADKVLILCGEN